MRKVVGPVVLGAMVMAACGPEPLRTGIDTMGTNGRVGEVLLRNVYLQAPAGGLYEPGDDATLRLRIVSDSERDDRLLAVSSAAEDVRIRWDRDCDGHFEVVEGLPVQAEGPVPYSTAYFVELVGLERTVRAGTTVPVTFEFEHAGVGRVDAMVEARRDGSRGSPLSCGQPSTNSLSPPDDGEVTVTGTVVRGVEPGCLLLDTDTTRYLITGTDSSLLEPGRRLTVSGIARPGTPTTCMQGVPLEAEQVSPAE